MTEKPKMMCLIVFCGLNHCCRGDSRPLWHIARGRSQNAPTERSKSRVLFRPFQTRKSRCPAEDFRCATNMFAQIIITCEPKASGLPHSLASLVKGSGDNASLGGGIPNLKFRFSHTHTNQNTKESLCLVGLCSPSLPAGIPPPTLSADGCCSRPPFDKGG